MPQTTARKPRPARKNGVASSKASLRSKPGPRFSVGLPTTVASQVERYAETVDTSMSKAIAALVRIGLESQAQRKSEFFKKLKDNLTDDDPEQQDRMVDEFRTLILGP